VPLEFVYEYEFPDKGAAIGGGAERALKEGGCPSTCQLKEHPNDFVCPIGFWGLSRVIERHAYDPTLPAPAIVAGDRNTPSRKQLLLRGPYLLAASKEVPNTLVTALGEQLKAFWRSGVEIVDDWSQWLKAIKQEPILFVVLPHAYGEGQDISLEISGHSIESALINRPYVYPRGSTRSPPIVLLLGCNTAGVAEMKTYARHITVFRQAQCAIVLATTAAVVWGADIAAVAQKLLTEFQKAAKNSEDCFGDILRDAKRRSVLDSQLVAICLAAIGDADWRLKIPHEA